METKFKVGDKVRVIDTGDLDSHQIKYIGKKGTITEISSVPYVQFKDNEDPTAFMRHKLELAKPKPKRIPFDLERALKGDEVVTRDGREVSNTGTHTHDIYVFVARPDGDIQRSYTKDGRAVIGHKYEFDLFMKHPAKVTETVELGDGSKHEINVCDKLDELKWVLNGNEPVKDYAGKEYAINRINKRMDEFKDQLTTLLIEKETTVTISEDYSNGGIITIQWS